jgi:hypothetical protein
VQDVADFKDWAAKILQDHPEVPDEVKADLWDASHQASTPDELRGVLATYSVPPEVKQQLFDAKQQVMGAPGPASKASQALLDMASLPPDVLSVAESHPKTAQALIAAAAKEAEAARKGVGAETGENGPESLLRPDIAPTPEDHALVQASDGGLHHIPIANLGDARTLDPKLMVLHVAVKAPKSKQRKEK